MVLRAGRGLCQTHAKKMSEASTHILAQLGSFQGLVWWALSTGNSAVPVSSSSFSSKDWKSPTMRRRHCPASVSGRRASIRRVTSTLPIMMWLSSSPGTLGTTRRPGSAKQGTGGWRVTWFSNVGVSPTVHCSVIFKGSPVIYMTPKTHTSEGAVGKQYRKLSFLINYICWQNASLFPILKMTSSLKLAFSCSSISNQEDCLQILIKDSWKSSAWGFWSFVLSLKTFPLSLQKAVLLVTHPWLMLKTEYRQQVSLSWIGRTVCLHLSPFTPMKIVFCSDYT